MAFPRHSPESQLPPMSKVCSYRPWYLPSLPPSPPVTGVAGWSDVVQNVPGERRSVLPEVWRADAGRLWKALSKVLLDGVAIKAHQDGLRCLLITADDNAFRGIRTMAWPESGREKGSPDHPSLSSIFHGHRKAMEDDTRVWSIACLLRNLASSSGSPPHGLAGRMRSHCARYRREGRGFR